MERVQKILLTAFWAGFGLTLLIAATGELNLIPVGKWQGNAELEFVVLTLMELVTLAAIPLALRLFKFKRVSRELSEKKEPALHSWGLLRLGMLLVPMFLNALFYYLFVNNSFGIMALILCCCMVFVYPGKKRCQAELEA